MQPYLFDFDGTLVDSMPIYISAMLEILDAYHISYGDDLVKVVTPLGAEDTAKYFINMGVPLPKETVMRRMKDNMLDGYRHRVEAKKYVIPTLTRLKEQGASLNILTASSHDTVDPCLDRLGIRDLFDHIWSCDDFGTTKADPHIYHMAAEELGVSAQAVRFFDDNLNAVQTAKQAGLWVCGVYDDSSAEYTDEIKRVADCYIEDFSKLSD